MAKIEMSATIGDLLTFYRQEHRIFGRCPHCGNAFRLSEAKLTYGKEPPRDVLTELKKERNRLQEKVDKLTAHISEMEEDHENEMGTIQTENEHEIDKLRQHFKDKIEQEVDRGMKKREKEIRKDAIARSRVTTIGKAIERIAPMFSGFGHHPADVRPIFEPLDFVIFEGLFRGGVTDVFFIEFKTGNSQLSDMQRSIRDAVARKRVHFEVARMTAEMQKKIETGIRLPALPAIETRRLR